ncbi:DNA-binding protein [Pyrobaculum neutrophilum]|uniref:DNA-binding protein Tneu_1679 n=1 Tax=Pyrobaculum neutrophilum (strain DSM 2338 / JCM 9278 / NBRC 100436 / V24Sta) TaxID=444157 RepID=Y1679_PYRNV|nr:DNA-binding protein [Pyrobaculum neutrophilum]B1YAF2.1 RecName: Full=DNA-binding protein Tneu_1679 [Pyrobaculum neutrophilum V24Sta]ACB40601.1 DNA-binding TFAR19-related protein [Pyrobaculum neutrophilum V24Sta]
MAEGGYEDRELEELRRKKLEELQKKAELERQAQIAAAQRRIALKKILTPAALARLDNIRVVRPELAEALEQQLIALASSGRVRVPIDEDTLKEILEAVYSQSKREYRFRL